MVWKKNRKKTLIKKPYTLFFLLWDTQKNAKHFEKKTVIKHGYEEHWGMQGMMKGGQQLNHFIFLFVRNFSFTEVKKWNNDETKFRVI